MANDLSTYGEGRMINWLLGGGATPPAAYYLALYTSAPSDAGGGVELTGNGYVRQAITWDPDTGLNTNLLRFQCDGEDWGAVTHGAIFDDASAGAFWAWAALTAPKKIPDGDALEFQPGTVTVEAD